MTMNAMRRNTPKTLADLSGGEYDPFTREKGFEDRVAEVASHARNRYILSFHPTDLTPGLHTIQVKLNQDYGAHVVARNSYWAILRDDATIPAQRIASDLRASQPVAAACNAVRRCSMGEHVTLRTSDGFELDALCRASRPRTDRGSGRGAGSLRSEQPYPFGHGRLGQGRVPRRRSGAVRPRRAWRRAQLTPRKTCRREWR